MHEVFDLYEKFLIAFIGIVTPGLTLFLNNYLIDRTSFEKTHKSETAGTDAMVNQQFEDDRANPDMNGKAFHDKANELLTKKKAQLDDWKAVVDKLAPKTFFRKNFLLLVGSMFFLFACLLVRSCKFCNWGSSTYWWLQISTGLVSIGLCVWHLINLVSLGFYLIKVRPIVDAINEKIKNDKRKMEYSPLEALAPELPKAKETSEQKAAPIVNGNGQN